MTDVNALFARAEGAFRQNRLEDARRDLMAITRQVRHPAVSHLLALVEQRRGAVAAARAAFAQAHALAPRDPQIANNLGNFLADLGETDAALLAYDRAIAAAPQIPDAALHRAIALKDAGREEEARRALDALLARFPTLAAGWSVLGALELLAADLDAAAVAFDRALAYRPDLRTALHGRARVALERGEANAADRFDAALRVDPDALPLVLGQAEAREAAGDGEAWVRLAPVVARHPEWVDGHRTLARMRWEAGDAAGSTEALEAALRRAPKQPDLWRALVDMLAGTDRFAAAADAAAAARRALGDAAEFALHEAVAAGHAGDDARAERLFAGAAAAAPESAVPHARHLLRRGDRDRAGAVLDAAIAAAPSDLSAWALRGLVWRLAGNARAAWLHEQPGLVAERPLPLKPAELDEITAALRALHRTRAFPVGQSLRGGTQTRGRLFARQDPAIRALAAAVEQAVAAHWAALPPPDPHHPLLRHRARRPRLAGSWSVRLTGQGFHVAHIHPQGLLSSAIYFVVPSAGEHDGQAGWLEIGRPPADLDLPLGPLVTIAPAPGRMVLFPSTLFHGTRPFAAGERLTAAFDVVA